MAAIERTNANFLFRLVVLLLVTYCVVHSHDESKEKEETVNDPGTVDEEVQYVTPKPSGFAYLAESFDDLAAYKSRWVLSNAKKEDTDETIAKYNGEWAVEPAVENALKGDFGLILKSKAKHHAIAVKLSKAFVFDTKPFIVQYEVNFQNGQDCGGAYIKLLTDEKDFNLRNFHDKTPYSIMFGPDKCGVDSKLHFIFKHRNPRNGTITEKHCKPASEKIDDAFKDKKPHLYTLVVRPDNTYEILVDNSVVNKGSLLEDFSPPVNPPAQIDDPNDRKPADWDEREKIPDPDAKKPDDWDEDAPKQIPDLNAKKPEDWLDDEPETLTDPSAIKPDDWDDEMDGEWEAPLIDNPKCEKVGCGEWKPPMIDNPKYKGKWHSPLIDNPNYKGKWKPKKIPNPDFFEDNHPFKMATIGALGIELWSMSDGIYFDNIIIADDKSVTDQWARDTWELKRKKVDQDSDGLISRVVKYTNSRPWLWALYLVAIGLPVVLIVVFCCFPSEDKEKKLAAKAKKSDLSMPDDEPSLVPEDVSAAGEPGAEDSDLKADNTKTEIAEPSGDEEENEEEQDDEVEEDDVEEENVKEEGEGNGDKSQKKDEEGASAEEESGNEQVSGGSGRSPRRRRARKD